MLPRTIHVLELLCGDNKLEYYMRVIRSLSNHISSPPINLTNVARKPSPMKVAIFRSYIDHNNATLCQSGSSNDVIGLRCIICMVEYFRLINRTPRSPRREVLYRSTKTTQRSPVPDNKSAYRPMRRKRIE